MRRFSLKLSPFRGFRACVVLLLLAAAGCFRNEASPGDTAKVPSGNDTPDEQAEFDAAQTLAKMRDAYQSAPAYSDQGRLHWQYLDEETWREGSAEFSTAFERPNRLALRTQSIHGLHATCDGEQLQAVIYDDLTNNFDSQMLQRKLAGRLGLEQLYEDDVMAYVLRGDAFDGTPWPLRLLLGDPSLQPWLTGPVKALGIEKLDGKTYRRIQLENNGKTATVWIDPSTYLLRRVELPLLDGDFGVRKPVADFLNAKIAAAESLDAKLFQLQPPPRAKVVSFFVAPVGELPSPIFGEVVDDFSLETADGKKVTRESLAGDIVLLAWFQDNPESAVALRQLQTVAKKFADEKRVRCFVVSPLPEMITSESLESILKKYNVELPLLRDTRAVGRDVFDVHGVPTIVMLNGEHRVQFYEAGVQRGLEDGLSQIVSLLLAGEDPAGQVRREFAEVQTEYRRNLAAAMDGSSTLLEIPPTRIAPAKGPSKLELHELWKRDDIASPGNVLVVPVKDGDPQIFVLDHGKDWRTIVELDAQGEIVKRIQLPVPETAAIALVRSAVDGDGKRWFAASARLGQRVYVFNENWELAFAYPPEQERHEGIGDFALVDFQGDGKLQLCVGFWGVLGVHGVDMTGNRDWSNRAAAPVVSLAVSPANAAGWRQIMATTNRGEIVPINSFGHNDAAERVANKAVTHLYARADDAAELSAYLGLAVGSDGGQTGLALTEELKIHWDAKLPATTHQNQIQWITSGQLLPGRVGQWVFAGADGSIGIISDDANFFDSFAVGEVPTGLAITQLGRKRVLIVATTESLRAWEVNLPVGPAAP